MTDTNRVPGINHNRVTSLLRADLIEQGMTPENADLAVLFAQKLGADLRSGRLEDEMAALQGRLEQALTDLRTAWLMVRSDAYDSPGHVTNGIRPFMRGAMERNGLDPR